ncbi:glycosyltransferase family 2 protein [Paenibacillus arenosi]|uniref:Glycosyltransferase family 2 protein n=1 Tax=Paenibacillus arenosi TaxID=2774142 RepID=A0ABR9B0S6_9BACL|nr:glycosyltransferase family 2 protein [Paenibacillus arenosi]MBD8499923.1 glycosyltransferase family 2 protein [Paenibacillus arenosi]
MTTPSYPITLCVIVRDEEDVLRRCLQSAKDLVAQIIVVDTGSTDASPAIAKECGASVYHFEWQDDFSAARNAAIDKAEQPWILMLDADEIIDRESWKEEQMQAFFTQPHVLGCYVRIAHLTHCWNHNLNHRPACSATDMACRLFRNDPRLRYAGRIHEDITSTIEIVSTEESSEAICWSSFTIWHDGYVTERLQNKDKSARNLHLLHLQLEEEPLNPLWWYAYGTEHFQAERYAEALPWLLRTITSLSKQPRLPGYSSDVWLKAVFTYYSLKQIDSAVRLAEEAMDRFPSFPDLLLLSSTLYAIRGSLAEAYRCAEKAASCGDRTHLYTSTDGASTWRAHWMAAFLAERTSNYAQAAHHYEHAAAYTIAQHPSAVLKSAAAWHRSDWISSSRWMRSAAAASEQTLPTITHRLTQALAASVHSSAAAHLLPFVPALQHTTSIDWASFTRHFLYDDT